jgi:membrane-bound serine protease (ClpP class)
MQRHVTIAALSMLAAVSMLRAQDHSTKHGVLIDVDGEIDLSMSAYVRRGLAEAASRNAPVVVLRINTFGGRVDAATQIRDALFECPVPTVAFVDDRAISAGALIALSCQRVAMVPGATVGAVTPVDEHGTKAPE